MHGAEWTKLGNCLCWSYTAIDQNCFNLQKYTYGWSKIGRDGPFEETKNGPKTKQAATAVQAP